jgi:hypothetical protein
MQKAQGSGPPSMRFETPVLRNGAVPDGRSEVMGCMHEIKLLND